MLVQRPLAVHFHPVSHVMVTSHIPVSMGMSFVLLIV